MKISVVIPTRNRKARLHSLLTHLNLSSFPFHEVIIVDSSDTSSDPCEYSFADKLNIIYLVTRSSVCIQRNIGITTASAPWIFLCDDDIEVPENYIDQLVVHLNDHPETGAVSGLVLQRNNDKWCADYPLTSGRELIWKYVFQLGIWGPIECRQHNFIVKKIKKQYTAKGNHISKAGWPVITDFTGDYFKVPVYGMGASLIRKDWLQYSPYDEVLDRHGIGDNYGVCIGFPHIGIDILKDAFVYHHHEPDNRLNKPLQYYRRALALDYFIKTKDNLHKIRKSNLAWSLLGSLIVFAFQKDVKMTKAAFKSLCCILLGPNPYYVASRTNGKVTEPLL